MAAKVEEAATRSGMSVSAWISRAAEERAGIAAGLRAMKELEEEEGPVPPEIRARVEADLATAEARMIPARQAG